MTQSAHTSQGDVHPLHSLRWRIVFWTTVVVAVALTSVVLLTRSVLINMVHEDSWSDVHQELDEFRQFIDTSLNPETGEPYVDAHDLIDAYLTRQIPDDEELFIGRTEAGYIQQDLSHIDSSHQTPLDTATDPLVDEIFNSGAHQGVFHHPERGEALWASITVLDATPVGTPQFAVITFIAEDLQESNAALRWLLLFAILGLGTSMLITWLVSGQITAPIRKLQQFASTTSKTTLTERVDVTGTDEVAHLARSFNDMLDRIEFAYRDQRQFVDDAGHELRTPITVVRGQLELLEYTESPEERQRSIQLATDELDRMARMVNDMLTLAVSTSGDFVSPEAVDVSELLIDIDDKASTISERARLVQLAEGTVELDRMRVTEAVLELVSNGLRYSDEAEKVEIGSDFHNTGPDRMFRIWVRDRGMGVPKDEKKHIFSRFSRGEQAHTSRPGGAGLGLSIVQAIAEAHGGEAFVDSTVGLGSVFGIELPAPDAGEPQGDNHHE